MIDDGRLVASAGDKRRVVAGAREHPVAPGEAGRPRQPRGHGWLAAPVRERRADDAARARAAAGPDSRQRREGGFTLLEIMVVIVILGLLIGLVAPAVLRQLGSARTSIARQSLTQLGSVLDLYKLDAGRYPSTAEGLQALVTAPADAANWNGPYVQGGKMPVDPWNHEYVYREPSTRPGHEYDLCSRGPDAQAASDGPGLICNE